METINLWGETINFWGALCSILATLSAIITFILKQAKKTRQYKFMSLCLFTTICLALLVSLAFIYQSIQYTIHINHLLWGIGILVLSFCLLLIYGHRAYHSLDNGDSAILPPKLLWQMVFNKIESRITNPSSKHIRFAVVSMDDSNAVKESVEKINDCYSDSEMYDVVLIDGYKKSKNNKLLFNLDKVQRDKDLSGVIFLIGTAGDESQSWKNLKTTIDNFSNIRRELPIGYIKNGNKRCFDLHYEEISSGQLENCIHNLIMRGYTRSRMQFELSNAYQSFFWAVIILIAALYIGILAGKYLILNKQEELAKEIINKYERTKKLEDKVYNLQDTLLWINIEPSLIKTDTAFQQTLTEVSQYYFSDLSSYKFIKIWMKTKVGDTMKCIFDNASAEHRGFRHAIPMNYLVGKVADYKIFFLWPGEINLNSGFNEKTVAWHWNMGKDRNRIIDGHWQKEGEEWKWTGKIDVDNEWKNAEIEWLIVDQDDFAAFCYSYDGYLVLEIDCAFEGLKTDYDYMANMTFRNSVRKYMKFVYCLLKNNNDKYKEKSM